MTRVKNWFTNKEEAVKAWEERYERLGHCIAVVMRSATNKKIGYYVGKPKYIESIDSRYSAEVIGIVPKNKKENRKAKKK